MNSADSRAVGGALLLRGCALAAGDCCQPTQNCCDETAAARRARVYARCSDLCGDEDKRV